VEVATAAAAMGEVRAAAEDSAAGVTVAIVAGEAAAAAEVAVVERGAAVCKAPNPLQTACCGPPAPTLCPCMRP
jgi:hypothetical protein